MPKRALLLATLSLLTTSCTPEPAPTELNATILSSVGEVLHPTSLYVRFDEPTTTLTVSTDIGGHELAHGSAVAGMKYAITLDGRACELESRGPRTDTETVTNDTSAVAPVRNPGNHTRTTKVLGVTLRCTDGQPLPGVASSGGVRGWDVTLSMAAMVVLGLLLGALYFHGDENDSWPLSLASLVLGIGALVAVFVFAWHHHTGGLVLTLPLLAAVCGGTAFFAALMALNNAEARAKIGAVGMIIAGLAGPAILSLTTPTWGWGAPLVAALLSFVTFAIAGGVAVSGK
ncbi:MAG: hypothetical protein QM817_29695 [Archangium sp.]